MKKVLGVYDIDQSYAEKLTNYLNRKEKNSPATRFLTGVLCLK